MDQSSSNPSFPRRASLVGILAGIACLVCFGQAQAGSLGLGAAGFAVNINFQTHGAATPSGYLPDCGFEYGARGSNYVYGWNVRNTTNGFERGLCANPLLDTGHKMQAGGQSFYWKIKVPRGLYDVVVAAGDPAVTNGSGGCRYSVNVENVQVISNCVPGGSAWFFGTNTHIQTWVNDGCLTLSNGPGAVNNSICYIQIRQIAPIYWGAAIIDNAGTHKCPADYVSESHPGVLGYYEGHTGKRISLLHWGNSWSSGSLSSQTNYMAKMWARGTIPMFTWSPGSKADDANYSLGSILAGRHDAFLTNWFKVAKAYGKPFFLNFAREMNGTWYTWSEGHSVNAGCPPGAFTNMWRHVHDICTGVGCTNITWIWVVDRDIDNDKHVGPLSRFYPGDDYVDWVGMDIYNAGAIAPHTGESLAACYGQTYTQVTNIAPAKPIIICETATKDLAATPKPAWIAEALMQLPSAFPNIRAFIWFNWNDRNPKKNWPIEGGDNTLPYTTAPVDWASVRAFSNGIASPFYLGSIFTNQANLSASPIRPMVLPAAPTNVTASAGNGSVRLRWSPVLGATHYNVYRSPHGEAGPHDSPPRSTTGTSYTDSAVVNGTTYCYVVTAQNLAGESIDSAGVSAAPTALQEAAVRDAKSSL